MPGGWRQMGGIAIYLRTIYHHELISEPESMRISVICRLCVRSTYQTNELASQLDLLYSFCQYQLHQYPNNKYLTPIGVVVNRLRYHYQQHPVLILNNLSSCSSDVDEGTGLALRGRATGTIE